MKKLLLAFASVTALLLLASAAQAGSKAYVCHTDDEGNRKTLRIGEPAVPAHEGHGDFVGTCDDAPPPPKEVAIIRCLADVTDTPITVVSSSTTEGAPEIMADPTYGLGESCAEALAALRDMRFRVEEIDGSSDGLSTTYVLQR